VSNKVQASIESPVPASGSLEFTDTARVKLSLEIDLAGELARTLITKKPANFADLTQRAVVALVAELSSKSGATDPQILANAALKH
jgi:hypothetical protein